MSIISERFMAVVMADAHWIALIILTGVACYVIGRFEDQYRRDKAMLRAAKIAADRPQTRVEITGPVYGRYDMNGRRV